MVAVLADVLADVGLTPEDETLYRALSVQREVAHDELPLHSDLAPADLAAGLERLAAVGFVTLTDHTVVIGDAALAIELLAARREAEAHATLAEVSALRRTARIAAEELVRSPRVHAGGTVVTITGADDVRDRLHDLARIARSELFAVDPLPDIVDALADSTATRHAIHTRASADHFYYMEQLQLRVLRGEKIRLHTNPAAPVIVADDKVAFVVTEITDDIATAGLIVHPGVLFTILRAQVMQTWERAIPLYQTHDGGDVWVLSDDDHALLHLLAAGLKDQAIARHLGIGLRTVVRRIGNLSRTLDAETRFQAGLQAAKRGLL